MRNLGGMEFSVKDNRDVLGEKAPPQELPTLSRDDSAKPPGIDAHNIENTSINLRLHICTSEVGVGLQSVYPLPASPNPQKCPTRSAQFLLIPSEPCDVRPH
jgi:hypothetical protein